MKLIFIIIVCLVIAFGGKAYYKHQQAERVAQEVAMQAQKKAQEVAMEAQKKAQEVAEELARGAAQLKAIEDKGISAVTYRLLDPKSANFRNVRAYAGLGFDKIF
jgi:uncharacterized protein HemX